VLAHATEWEWSIVLQSVTVLGHSFGSSNFR
jgi:hypothetical protein